MLNDKNDALDPDQTRRFAFYALGFFRPKLWKRLHALGHKLSPFGIFGADAVLVWGRKPVSKRGQYMAKRKGLALWSVEDAFIRSKLPGWFEAPAGLVLDAQAIYYDASCQSDLITQIENQSDLVDLELTRARMKRQTDLGISKYYGTMRGGWTQKDYILVVDQVAGDASIHYGNARADDFEKMLAVARKENPDAMILIRTHLAGTGHFSNADADAQTQISSSPANPWDVLEGAKKVYCVTSQMGFEAIIAGHVPRVFGQPFFAGWGLSVDEKPIKRARKITKEELYHHVMVAYPKWFDAKSEPCDFDQMLDGIEAKLMRQKRITAPIHLKNSRAWKRPFLAQFFPNQSKIGQVVEWGAKSYPQNWIIEDGFLRSKGLGATLVPPLSLILDRVGIYFDPNHPSELEKLIHDRENMSAYQKTRAKKLRERIVELGLSKYNLEAENAPIIDRACEVILVPGQVEDDRSILLGATGEVKNTADLLRATRNQNPDAFIIYKPHPDVMSGLRNGVITTELADLVYKGGSLEPLWEKVDHVATITSQTGFEALLRGKKVSCFGMPFYADWGLTQDFAPTTGRRGKASLDQLVHASLIDYPLYFDPITRSISTPEIIALRLAMGDISQAFYLRAMTKIQQYFYRMRDFISG